MSPDDLAPLVCLSLATLLVLALACRVWLEIRRSRRIRDARRRRDAGRQSQYLMTCRDCGTASWEEPPAVGKGEDWRVSGKKWAWNFVCGQCRKRKAG